MSDNTCMPATPQGAIKGEQSEAPLLVGVAFPQRATGALASRVRSRLTAASTAR